MMDILLVDDIEVFRRQFKRMPVMKENSGFQIAFEADHGLEALEILQNNKVDMVITDIRMDIMDGLELLKEIKNRHLCDYVILLSEYSDFNYAKEGLVYGAFDYLVKPIDDKKVADLFRRIEEDQLIVHSGAYKDKEVEIFAALLINNNPDSVKAGTELINRILDKPRIDSEDSVRMIQEILNKVKEIITESKPWLHRFYDVDQLFRFPSSFHKKPDAARNYCEMLFAQINQFSVSSRSDLVQAVSSYIIENAEGKITLGTIAEMFYVNKTYVSHIFKLETGVSFVDYVSTVKIQRAKRLLLESNIKVYELAHRLGYEDVEYFSRVFKKITGMSTLTFRNRRLKK